MRTTFTAILLAGCLACTVPAAAITIVTRPVNVQGVTPDSVTIVWHTLNPTTAAVEYGPTLAYGMSAESKIEEREHALVLRDLRPAQLYYYRVRCGTEVLYEGPDYYFRARADKRTTRFRFLVFGDSGKGDAAQESLVPAMLAAQADFVAHTGDVIYPAGRREDFDPKYFEPYEQLLRNTPVWLVMGNHDYMTENGQPYLDAYFLPRNPAGNERYYSFDYGRAHFVMLDSNAMPDSGLLSWLQRDLSSSTTEWKFAFMHHPMYSCGLHGSNTSLRRALAPLFEAHGVDIVFAGHDHDYQRSHPMRAETPIDAAQEPRFENPGGVLYIVTGGGASPRSTSTRCTFTSKAYPATHFTQVDVDGDSLRLQAVTATGGILDEISIRKSRPGGGAAAGASTPQLRLDSTPNPFNPNTMVSYELNDAARVRLSVHDVTGREVRSLFAGPQDAGTQRVFWDGRDDRGNQVASGVYWLRLEVGSASASRKVILAK